MPDTFERARERFRLALDDRETSESLFRAVKGKGAFQRFREAIEGFGMADKWHA